MEYVFSLFIKWGGWNKGLISGGGGAAWRDVGREWAIQSERGARARETLAFLHVHTHTQAVTCTQTERDTHRQRPYCVLMHFNGAFLWALEKRRGFIAMLYGAPLRAEPRNGARDSEDKGGSGGRGPEVEWERWGNRWGREECSARVSAPVLDMSPPLPSRARPLPATEAFWVASAFFLPRSLIDACCSSHLDSRSQQ